MITRYIRNKKNTTQVWILKFRLSGNCWSYGCPQIECKSFRMPFEQIFPLVQTCSNSYTPNFNDSIAQAFIFWPSKTHRNLRWTHLSGGSRPSKALVYAAWACLVLPQRAILRGAPRAWPLAMCRLCRRASVPQPRPKWPREFWQWQMGWNRRVMNSGRLGQLR